MAEGPPKTKNAKTNSADAPGHAGRELEAERAFTAALLENVQDGIVACDADGTLTLFNRTSRVFHGLPSDGLPAAPLPPETWAAHFDLFRADGLTPLAAEEAPLYRALRGETVRDAEGVIAPADAPARSVVASGGPLFGPDGAQLGAVVLMRDVTAQRAAERELARLAAIVESSEEAIIAGTLDGTLVAWNQGAERLYGFHAREMIGQHWSVLSPHEKALGPEMIMRMASGETIPPQELVRTRRDGSFFHAALSLSPIRDAAGRMIGVSCISRDITARKRAELALAETHATLRAVLESAPIILYATNADGVVTLSEGRGLAALGLAPGEAVGRSAFELMTDPEQAAQTRRALAGEDVAFDWHVGPARLHAELRPARDAHGQVTGLIGVCFDVTERRRAEEERVRAEERIRDYNAVLERQKHELQTANAELARANAHLAALATTDGLTGLTNHRAFQERLADETLRAARYGLPLSVVFLDVDRFKEFNDAHGHPAGDEVLRTVASLLRAGVRDGDVAARYGGEEFALILTQTDMSGAAAVAERIRRALQAHPWPLRPVTASFGVAALRPGEDTGSPLIARAHTALYHAKTAGRNLVEAA